MKRHAHRVREVRRRRAADTVPMPRLEVPGGARRDLRRRAGRARVVDEERHHVSGRVDDVQPADLTGDAQDVADAWNRLPEPHRSRIRQEILNLVAA